MKKAIIVFLILFVVIAFVTLFFPIKMYDGEVLILQPPGKIRIEDQKLSLSFLVNKAAFLKDYPDVKDIYLNKIGWAMIVAVNIALPLMIAYRTTLKKHKK